jgi:threonine/homoserine/homoserine lactone efflux protein
MSIRQWIAVSLFMFLVLLCAGLFIVADFVGPSVRETLKTVAADGFKTALAALIGALSVLVGEKR